MQWLLSHPIIFGLIAAVIFELITIIFRFGFKLTSQTHTSFLARFTKGYRMHHGYPGAVMFVAIPLVPQPSIISSLIIIFALMLFISDFIHHTIVLPIFTGHHEFHIKYPDPTTAPAY